MKFNIRGALRIEFIDLDANDRGVRTIRHRIVGEIEADSKSAAVDAAETEAKNFIDVNYPVRWKSEIDHIKAVQI